MLLGPLYHAINFNLASGGKDGIWGGIRVGLINSTGLRARIAAYVCPSDAPFGVATQSANPFSQSSYAESAGTWNIVAYFSGPECWQQDVGNGAFDDLTVYRPSQFTDGLSETIFVGETSRLRNDPDPECNQWSQAGLFQVAKAFDPSGATVRPRVTLITPAQWQHHRALIGKERLRDPDRARGAIRVVGTLR